MRTMLNTVDGAFAEWGEGPPIGKACYNSDEYLFILWLKSFYPQNTFDNEIRFIPDNIDPTRAHIDVDEKYVNIVPVGFDLNDFLPYDVDARQRLTKMVTDRVNTIDENTALYMPRIVWWLDMAKGDKEFVTWVGLDVCFNPEDLDEYYWVRPGNKIYKDGELVETSDSGNPQKIRRGTTGHYVCGRKGGERHLHGLVRHIGTSS